MDLVERFEALPEGARDFIDKYLDSVVLDPSVRSYYFWKQVIPKSVFDGYSKRWVLNYLNDMLVDCYVYYRDYLYEYGGESDDVSRDVALNLACYDVMITAFEERVRLQGGE